MYAFNGNLKSNKAREGESKINARPKLKKYIDKRFLLSSYKEGLYIKITSLSQENIKVSEYIREFE